MEGGVSEMGFPCSMESTGGSYANRTRQGDEGQTTEVLGYIHTEEFLLVDGQQEAICCLPKWG